MLFMVVAFLAKTVLYLALGTGAVALAAIVTKPKLETIDEEIRRQLHQDNMVTVNILSSLSLATKNVKDTDLVVCRAAKVHILGKTYGMIGAFGSWITIKKS